MSKIKMRIPRDQNNQTTGRQNDQQNGEQQMFEDYKELRRSRGRGSVKSCKMRWMNLTLNLCKGRLL